MKFAIRHIFTAVIVLFTVSGCATIGNISSTITQPSAEDILAAIDKCFDISKADQETLARLYSEGGGESKPFSENGFYFHYVYKNGEGYCGSIDFTAGLNRIAEAQQLLANKLGQSGKSFLLFNMVNGHDVTGSIWLPDYNLSLFFTFNEGVRWGEYKSTINFYTMKTAVDYYVYDKDRRNYDKNIDKYSNIYRYPIKSKEWYQEVEASFATFVKRMNRTNAEGERMWRQWRKEEGFSMGDFAGAMANVNSQNIFTLKSPYGNDANFVPTYSSGTSVTPSAASGGGASSSLPQKPKESGTVSSGNNSASSSSSGSGVKTPSMAYGSSNSSGSGSKSSAGSSVKAPSTTSSSSSNSSGSGSSNNAGSGISFTAVKNEAPKIQKEENYGKSFLEKQAEENERVKRQNEERYNNREIIKCGNPKGCAKTM